MIAAQRAHHCAPSPPRGEQRLAHRVPHVHERNRSGCGRAGPYRARAARPQRREVQPDAAAVLHRNRGFLQRLQDAFERIDEPACNETVEKRYVPGNTGTREDAPTRQKSKSLERSAESLLPLAFTALYRCYRPGNPGPGIGNAGIRHPVAVGTPVTRGPDQLGDVCRCHLFSVCLTASVIVPSPAGMK